MSAFKYCGMYRVQSRRKEVYSEIEGDWYSDAEKLLTSEKVNAALKNSFYYKSNAVIGLKAAKVKHRTGLFAQEPDILYKEQFFVPANDSAMMPFDIVDLMKSIDYWEKRKPYNIALFDLDTWTTVNRLIPDLATTVANEYYCHEAGHLLGYDVRSKYEDGYFCIQGRTAWPLIFVEEFRADLHSFSYALDLLPRDLAIQTFLYNIFLRFGLEAYSIKNKTQGYGLVPYLLFYLLYDLGFITVKKIQGIRRMQFSNLKPEYIVSIMRSCADHAESNLTNIEFEENDPIDIVINSASYFRKRMLDQDRYNLYSEALISNLGFISD